MYGKFYIRICLKLFWMFQKIFVYNNDDFNSIHCWKRNYKLKTYSKWKVSFPFIWDKNPWKIHFVNVIDFQFCLSKPEVTDRLIWFSWLYWCLVRVICSCMNSPSSTDGKYPRWDLDGCFARSEDPKLKWLTLMLSFSWMF